MLLFSNPHDRHSQLLRASTSTVLYLAFLRFCISCHPFRRDSLFCHSMTEDTILQTSTANGSWSNVGDPQAKRLSLTFCNPFGWVRAKARGQRQESSLWSEYIAKKPGERSRHLTVCSLSHWASFRWPVWIQHHNL